MGRNYYYRRLVYQVARKPNGFEFNSWNIFGRFCCRDSWHQCVWQETFVDNSINNNILDIGAQRFVLKIGPKNLKKNWIIESSDLTHKIETPPRMWFLILGLFSDEATRKWLFNLLGEEICCHESFMMTSTVCNSCSLYFMQRTLTFFTSTYHYYTY